MLYTRYRPTHFAQLVGQETTAQILKKAVAQGRLAHSYLFTGPRGTGKTTTARLLAKIINCSNRTPEGDCCQECDHCKAIDKGTYLDLIEIDAASNRGIDQIRELKERIEFAPSLGSYKVYIIDEVHMLTTEAFNALLKTLEEPPAHVVFILATTEPHKLPATILSRCQRFDFHTGSQQSLQEVIERVVKAEGYTVTPQAIQLLVQHAGGSYRDALSLLDVVVSGLSSEDTIDEVVVRASLGLVEEDLMKAFLQGLADRNAPSLLEVVNQLTQRGGNVHYFIRELIMVIRDQLWAALQGKQVSQPLLNAQSWSPISVQQLQQLIAWLLEANNQIKEALLPTLPLEIVIARWLAQETSSVAVQPPSPQPQSKVQVPVEQPTPSAEPKGKVVMNKKPKADSTASIAVTSRQPAELNAIQSRWPDFIQAIRKHNPHLYAFLSGSELLELVTSDGSEELWIGVKFNFHKERIEAVASQEVIRQLAQEIFGQPLRVRCQIKESVTPTNAPSVVAVNEVLDVFMGDLE